MKRTIINSAVALSLLLGTAASAQNTATTEPMPPAPGINKTRLGELKADLKAKGEIQLKREDVKAGLLEAKFNSKEEEEAFKKAMQEKRAALADELKTKREALQGEIKAKREALKAEITKVKKERVIVRKGYVEQKLRQVVVVITEKQARLQKAIDTLKAKGEDTAEAQVHIDESKASLKIAVEKLELLAKVVVTENEPKPLEEARTLAKAAEAALKSAREHLVEAIQELKLITGETTIEANASATVTTNPEN